MLIVMVFFTNITSPVRGTDLKIKDSVQNIFIIVLIFLQKMTLIPLLSTVMPLLRGTRARLLKQTLMDIKGQIKHFSLVIFLVRQ